MCMHPSSPPAQQVSLQGREGAGARSRSHGEGQSMAHAGAGAKVSRALAGPGGGRMGAQEACPGARGVSTTACNLAETQGGPRATSVCRADAAAAACTTLHLEPYCSCLRSHMMPHVPLLSGQGRGSAQQ